MKKVTIAIIDKQINPIIPVAIPGLLPAEITAKILKLKYSIKEVPILYYSRDYSEGKKITWKDGLRAARALIMWRFYS